MNQGATNSGFQTTVQRLLLHLVHAPMLTAVHQQRRLEFSHRYRNWASNERRQYQNINGQKRDSSDHSRSLLPFGEFLRRAVHAEEIKQNGKTCQQMIAMIGTIKDYIGPANIPTPSDFIEIFGKTDHLKSDICLCTSEPNGHVYWDGHSSSDSSWIVVPLSLSLSLRIASLFRIPLR
ncbi:hypothetical protein TNCV_1000561 [Trichonephila clavipes]|nr:hypothetical protein TNCV_1000561 [Trichonephila clavipes]